MSPVLSDRSLGVAECEVAFSYQGDAITLRTRLGLLFGGGESCPGIIYMVRILNTGN